MNTILKSIIAVVLVVVGGLIFFSIKTAENRNEDIPEIIENSEEEIVVEPETTIVKIPLAPMEQAGDFGPFGCGQYLNFHPVEVPKTTSVLTAVYTQLFNSSYEFPGTDDKNIIASQENLNFDSVTITDGNANLYLSGFVMGNHCGDEVFRHQIEQSAFQFDTVDSITVYVNNEIFDWCSISDAGPEEGFCAQGPLLWIKQKS